MTMICITLVKGELTAEQRPQLMARLAEAVAALDSATTQVRTWISLPDRQSKARRPPRSPGGATAT